MRSCGRTSAAPFAAQDALLLGRGTYDAWAGFWPGSDVEPFASFINGVQKFVVTSAPLEHESGYLLVDYQVRNGDLLGL